MADEAGFRLNGFEVGSHAATLQSAQTLHLPQQQNLGKVTIYDRLFIKKRAFVGT